jgi:F0F1-type ATP synthase assembly protein I
MDKETKKLYRTLGYLSTVDKKFHTSPWLFFVFLGFGIVAAFRNLQIMYKKLKDS